MGFKEKAIGKIMDGILTALVVGFFALFGWMAKTVYDTGKHIESINQRMIAQEELDDRQTDTYNKLLYDMKKSIDILQEKLDTKENTPIINHNENNQPNVERPKPPMNNTDTHTNTNHDKEYEAFDAVIQQQIAPRGKR
jgi:hypothetical protein